MNLLLTGAYNYTKEQIGQLEALGFQTTFVQDEREALEIPVKNIDATVCNGLFLANDIATFKQLKFIQLTSAGTDRVPMDYITENNIRLETARGVYSIPIAEWVVLKILEIFKKSRPFYAAQQKHNWQKQRDLFELSGKKAVIIGYGSIGVEIAKRLHAFGVELTAVDSRIPEKDEIRWISSLQTPENMDAALAANDIVILTLPLTTQTRHLINAQRLDAMKEDAVLVNVSRGEIIDEAALIAALEHKKFSGIALDVFESEPLPPDSPLWNFENVIITPHNAYASENNHRRLFDLMFDNLKDFIENCS